MAVILAVALGGSAALAGCSETDFRQEAYTSVSIDVKRDVSVGWTLVDKDVVDVVATNPSLANPNQPPLPGLTEPDAVEATRQLTAHACSKEAANVAVLAPMDDPSYSVRYSDCSKTDFRQQNPALVTLNHKRDVSVSWYRPRANTIEIEAFDLPPVTAGTPPAEPLSYDQAYRASLDVATHRCGPRPNPIESPRIFGTDHYTFRYYCGDADKAGAGGAW